MSAGARAPPQGGSDGVKESLSEGRSHRSEAIGLVEVFDSRGDDLELQTVAGAPPSNLARRNPSNNALSSGCTIDVIGASTSEPGSSPSWRRTEAACERALKRARGDRLLVLGGAPRIDVHAIRAGSKREGASASR